MKYIDDLDDLLKFLGNKTVATMGINNKNRVKGFHKGHDLCLKYLLETDADIKMVQLSDMSENGDDYSDIDYMQEYLEEVGVDVFYYMSDFDYNENWRPQANIKQVKQMMKKVTVPKHLLEWCIAIYLSDQLYNRQYWIGSSKDSSRKILGEFCKEHTNIKPIIITRVKL